MDVDYSFLQALWFILISILWIGYFVLEGFDFGVGMLLRKLGHTNSDRRAIIHSIGPVWDGNEVWLITAGGATFAAFPGWYASLFSGFYIALFLILVALIVRGVSFEFWGKSDNPRWRSAWEWATVVSSFLAALLWGVAWANIVRGVPINGDQDFTGDLFTLLNPYGLLGGVTTVLLFLAHGAIYLNLRTGGDLPERARAVARWASPAAAVAGIAFLAWTAIDIAGGDAVVIALAVIGALLLAASAMSELARRPGLAFGLSAFAIVALFATLFVELFPQVMPSSTNGAFDLTIANTSSSDYTLTVMTIVALILVPVIAHVPVVDLLGVPQARLARGVRPRAAQPARRHPRRPGRLDGPGLSSTRPPSSTRTSPSRSGELGLHLGGDLRLAQRVRRGRDEQRAVAAGAEEPGQSGDAARGEQQRATVSGAGSAAPARRACHPTRRRARRAASPRAGRRRRASVRRGRSGGGGASARPPRGCAGRRA